MKPCGSRFDGNESAVAVRSLRGPVARCCGTYVEHDDPACAPAVSAIKLNTFRMARVPLPVQTIATGVPVRFSAILPKLGFASRATPRYAAGAYSGHIARLAKVSSDGRGLW